MTDLLLYILIHSTFKCNCTCISSPLLSQVYVVPPIEMSFISSLVEIEVGGSLYLPLQVLGRTLDDPPMTLPFFDCRFMGFQYSLADEAIFNISIDHNISKRRGNCLVVSEREREIHI